MQKKSSLPEIKNNIPEFLGIIISIAGLVVMAGWFFNIGLLKSILPVWASMKFSTALAFVLSGTILYFGVRWRKQNQQLASIFLPIIGMLILLLMLSLLASTVIGISLGVEEFFVKDSIAAVGSVTPGRPSVATMINFTFIAIYGFFICFEWNKIFKIEIILSILVGLTGLVAVFGYIFNQPLWYFQVSGRSSAMALHTAILFVLWSIGAVLTIKK